MKLLITIIIVLISLNINAQSLKGYTLGEKLVGPSAKFTTVAGIEGGITVETLKDGTIALIAFAPCTSDGETILRISETVLNRLKRGIEERYGVILTKKEEKYTENFMYYAADFSNNAMYFIKVDYNQFFDSPYQILFMITNEKMNDMQEIENQQKANSDF